LSTGHLSGVLWILLAATAAAAAPSGDTPGRAAAVAAVTHAQAQVRLLSDGVQRIERAMPLARGRAVRISCVTEKVAEAKAGLRIGSDDLADLEAQARADASPASTTAAPAPVRQDARQDSHRDAKAEDEARSRAYRLGRLELLVARSGELEREALLCADDDHSAIDVTRVEVSPLAPSGLVAPDDPTAPPSNLQPPSRPPER
jgi:hypothetical protein